MRIAFVNATRSWGGVKTWILDFASELARRGHDIRIYGRQPEFVEAARSRVGHGAQAPFGFDGNPRSVRWFCRAFRDQGTEVVFVNVNKCLATAGIAARLMGIPVVQQIGLPLDVPYRLKTHALHRWIRPWFLSSCRYIEAGFLASLPYLRAEDSHVVLTAKRLGPAPGAPHQPRRLVATQQLCADKEHATLLRALGLLARQGMDFRLHLAGVGPEEGALKALANEEGLEDRLVWHGFVRDVPALLRESDIFLLASSVEGLPNTLQEALAEGLLPVIRDVGGVREVLTPPLEAWVLPFEAGAEAFAERIGAALALDDAALQSLRHEAQHACEEHCGLERKATELEDWLRDTVIPGRKR